MNSKEIILMVMFLASPVMASHYTANPTSNPNFKAADSGGFQPHPAIRDVCHVPKPLSKPTNCVFCADKKGRNDHQSSLSDNHGGRGNGSDNAHSSAFHDHGNSGGGFHY